MNIYNYKFWVKCPKDDAEIEYSLEIKSEEMILVEDIIKACVFPAAYQEQVADRLNELLPGNISVIADHQGVSVTTLRREA